MCKQTPMKRWLALLLSIAMMFSLALPAFAAGNEESAIDEALLADVKEIVKQIPREDRVSRSDVAVDLDAQVNPDREVRVSIVLEAPSTIAQGYSTINIAENTSAMNYRDSLRAQQEKVQAAIESELDTELDVVWNLTLAANIISANVRYGDIKAIEAVPGVKSVYVENRYSPDVISIGGEMQPDMAIAGQVDGAQAAWDAGYTGEGTVIAIIDTGLDTDHQSFNNDAFLEAVNKDNLKLSESDVLAVADKLNATTQKDGNESAYYRNEKVPFGWSYIDHDDDITHDNDTEGEHGSHVAGIAAANRLVKVNGEYVDALDAVKMAGDAPDAQLLIMKVFGNGGGAYDSDCAAAIEDAILLKADAVNLSLGMALPGFAAPTSEDDPYAQIQEDLTNSDTVVVFSAGNAGSWAENTFMGYLYNDGVSYQMGGESGSYTNSFTVASVDNSGFIGATAKIGSVEFGWTDGSLGPAFRTLDTNGNGTSYNFVMVNPEAAGHDAEIVAALANEVKGAIYITWRGTSSFFEKGNAGAGAGAVGVLVANNQGGTISMDLTGYTGSVPVASTLQSDGLAIWNAGTPKAVPGTSYQYITGTITVNGTVGAHTYDTDHYTMSSFSSWGTTGDLALKPEISAFGGNIYSVWGSNRGSDSPQSAHDQYELMSGTSMAAPQITGMSALVQQYLRESEDITLPENVSARALTQGLIMASAEAMKDADGNYYSLLQQGAGLANVENAIKSPVAITVDDQNDGKVKAELGDDPSRSGEYVVEFDIHNMTGEAYDYQLDLDAFTQAYLTEVYGEKGEYLDYATRALDIEVDYEIDGDLYEIVPDLRYDFDDDGDQDRDDAQLLLDHIIKGTPLKANAENADVNEDGNVDTLDVHILLNTELPDIAINAKETVHVKVTFKLTEAEKAKLDEQNPDGAYVEAFIFVQPVATLEGELMPELSIPVLAYYGNWTDASMYEVGDAYDWLLSYMLGTYTVGGRYPYTADVIFDGQGNIGLTNMMVDDDYYYIDGSSLAADVSGLAYWYTLIRNAGNGVIQITDQNNEVIWRSDDLGPEYGVTYYENARLWLRPSLSGSLYYSMTNEVGIDWDDVVANLPKGTNEITISLIMAPEYYAQYNYDWDALTDGNLDNGELGPGAYLSTTFQVDVEPPVITSYDVKDEDDGTHTITVNASDNLGLDYALLVNNKDGDYVEVEFDNNPTEGTVTFTGLESSIYLLAVVDVVGNIDAKRIEVGEKFTEVVESIDITDDAIELVVGNTYQLTAEVGPYNLSDDAMAVTWKSSDDSVATVDANGVVTAVSNGTATITATTVYTNAAGEQLSDTCEVSVITIALTFNGLVWDEDGNIWWSEIDTSKLPDYKKLNSTPTNSNNIYFSSAAVDLWNEVLFASTWDGTGIGDATSDFYVVDPITLESEYIGPADFPYTDMADANGLGIDFYLNGISINAVVATYGPYLLIVDATTGEYIAAFENKAGTNYVGVAYAGTGQYSATVYYDAYYLVDTNGAIYLTALLYGNVGAGPDFYSLGFNNTDENNVLLETGIGTDVPYFNSMYYTFTDTRYIVWSRFSQSENDVDIIVIDEETEEIYMVGSFADGVWPVGGLVTLEDASYTLDSIYTPDRIASIQAVDPALMDALKGQKAVETEPVEEPSVDATEPVEEPVDDVTEPVEDETTEPVDETVEPVAQPSDPIIAVGDLDNVTVTEKTSSTTEGVTVDEENRTITVPVRAVNSTNGEFTVTYDPAVLTYVGHEYGTMLTSGDENDLENGSLHVGYAEKSAVSAPVVTLEFTYDEDFVGTTNIDLEVTQDGTNKNTTEDTYEIEVLAESDLNLDGGDTWTGSSDGNMTFVLTASTGVYASSVVVVYTDANGNRVEIPLGNGDYTIDANGNIVLTSAFLGKLANGDYTLEVTLSNGETVTDTFKINVPPAKSPEPSDSGAHYAPSGSPQTGDDSNLVVWLLLMVVSGVVLAAPLYQRKRYGQKAE